MTAMSTGSTRQVIVAHRVTPCKQIILNMFANNGFAVIATYCSAYRTLTTQLQPTYSIALHVQMELHDLMCQSCMILGVSHVHVHVVDATMVVLVFKVAVLPGSYL